MRWTTAWLAAGALVVPTLARAGAPPQGSAPTAGETPPSEPSPTEDPKLARARELYEQGEARFATADYLGAIELWTQAFADVPDTADAARIQAALIFNIATAREKAFEVSGDATHLRQARVLMEDYLATIPALYGDGEAADEERARVTARLNGIVRRIEQVERQEKRARRGPTGPDRGPEGDPKRARALIGSGAALLVVGVGGLAMMTAGLVVGRRANDISDLEDDDIEARRDQFRRGRTGNALAIAGGVTGGVFAITGAVLLALGEKERRKTLAWAPVLGPDELGLALAVRF